ncbi:hypothetical protein Agabi119p4_6324 [Agaricus bisporus var. burnettii]|uniref:Methyltransferase type 11 domain-containing protein n=1 Tax=Agaricus bisporus var. burnettii TaxID=192524 RepID=A0A8H7EZW1_AGABI|nr:hypothetical protein Agabi119p4_6324 [Agaricus bisporus var. burnettii]
MSTGVLPDTNEAYGAKEYWDQRYSQETENADFDWFKSMSRILMLGCGNSKLSEDMWEDGYKNIVNTDYSRVLIENMKQRHGEARPEMQWYEMDVRDLKFDEESFDVAIDKGTMDAMMTTKGDVWDPPEQVIRDCNKEVDEALRVLRKGGSFIYLTFGQPHFRRRYLARPDTTLEIRALGYAFHYYLYIVRKI